MLNCIFLVIVSILCNNLLISTPFVHGQTTAGASNQTNSDSNVAIQHIPSFYTTSVTQCARPAAGLNMSAISLDYFKSNNTVRLYLNASTSLNDLNPVFTFYLQTYGKVPLNQRLDFCAQLGIFRSLLCPFPLATNISTALSFPLPQSFQDSIPSIGYGIPDLEAVAELELSNAANANETLGCYQLTLSNGLWILIVSS